MKRVLSLKHWQLFLLIFICGAWTSPSPLKEIINSIAVVTFTLWIYAIGIYGQERIEALGLKPMNLKLFKVNVFIVSAFVFASLIFSAIFGETNETTTTSIFADILGGIAGAYVVFAMFQTIFFVCKTIAKIELRREVSFDDYVKNLLCMAFFFVGIWILQPKVNRLIAEEEIAFQ